MKLSQQASARTRHRSEYLKATASILESFFMKSRLFHEISTFSLKFRLFHDTHQVKPENQKSSEQHQMDTEMIAEVR
jgi:hypothetical protein